MRHQMIIRKGMHAKVEKKVDKVEKTGVNTENMPIEYTCKR